MRFLKNLAFLLVSAFFIIALCKGVQAAAGNVWIDPSSKTVNTNATFDLEVRVDSGTNKLGAYKFIVTFNSILLNVDTSKGTNGVDKGPDGFITAVNTNNSMGSLTVNGFDVNGKGPGSNLRVLIIHFKSLANTASATIGLYVETLTDEIGTTIGTPSGTGGTVNIQVSQSTLNVTVSPSSGGTVTGTDISCPGDCSNTYDQGTPVTLTATPNSGFFFERWSGCTSTSGNQCTVNMNTNMSVTAYFSDLSGLPLPSEVIVYSYLPVENAVENENNPSLCKPFGVGNITGGMLSLRVKIPPFSGPIDTYILIYAPQVDNQNLYLITSYSIQPYSMGGLVPWKANTYGDIDEALFQVDTSILPSSIYYVYLLATPAGKTDNFYLWGTYFVNPSVNFPSGL